MARLRSNFEVGTVTNNPLTSAGATLNSAELASVPLVSSPDIMAITIDPDGAGGQPEIVHITDHVASATSATITRGQEGTIAREHAAGTNWVNALTAEDIDDLYAQVDNVVENYLPLAGGSMLGPLLLADDPSVALGAATKQYVDGLSVELDWDAITGKPTTFPPDPHVHDAGEIETGTINPARLPAATATVAGVLQTDHTHPYISSSTPQNIVGNSYAAWRVRNIYVSSAAPTTSGRQTGDIWFET